MPMRTALSAATILLAAATFTGGTAFGRALSDNDQAIYRAAFHSIEHEKWRDAAKQAHKAKDQQLAKVIAWLNYQRDGTAASFSEITRFIDEHPNWPRLHNLRRRAERNIKVAFEDAEIVSWFDAYPPLTGEGALAYVQALFNAGRDGTAKSVLRESWMSLDFQSAVDEKRLVKLFGRHLTQEEHTARLERLLWARETVAAARFPSSASILSTGCAGCVVTWPRSAHWRRRRSTRDMAFPTRCTFSLHSSPGPSRP